MKRFYLPLIALVLLLSSLSVRSQDLDPPTLPGTPRLDWTDEPSVRIVQEAHQYLDRKLADSIARREAHWSRDASSGAAYEKSVEPNRRRLRQIIGAVDERLPVVMEHFGDDQNPALVTETGSYRAYQVRWCVLDGVYGEGLLLEPKGPPVAQVVAIPDADQTPEQLAGLADGIEPASQFARRMAENGCRVVVPVLIDRACTFSGNPAVRMTNQPHREWIYRQAYEMGRHVIGYEVQKVSAVIDWFERVEPKVKTAVVGYAEGGLLAFYAAAVDTRIDACLVSGYFDSRQRLWEEPIYRNVWGLLDQFGDAEIATLIVPRALIVEYASVPEIDGPPAAPAGARPGAAPGVLSTPPLESVRDEFRRAQALDSGGLGPRHILFGPKESPIGPGSKTALKVLAQRLGLESEMTLSSVLPEDNRSGLDLAARQLRQVKQLTDHIQRDQRNSDGVRDAFFLDQANLDSAETFVSSARKFREHLRREVIGSLDDPLVDPNPRSRKVYDNPNWIGYEVALEVLPGLHAWGFLLAPRDVKPGERRPVVVCQHGLEGLPEHTIETTGKPFQAYKGFAAALADRGFITFAPFNLYRGQDQFRTLQRKANPLGLSLFSIITRQHEQLLNWLASLPYVDKSRIAFYGLSYGGKTAMRVPAQLEGYCLSICSADFNDWIRKNVSVHSRYSYMFGGEWEMFEFDLGNTFSYAEMAYLIFPRPFMVERGHRDGVAPDPWVAYEYAKVRHLYARLGQGDKTEIEFFDGPHTINGQGTFDFLHKHLDWPKPQGEAQPRE